MRDPESYYAEAYSRYPWGDAYGKWVDANPLRQWRFRYRPYKDSLAPYFRSLLGISLDGARKLERGYNVPSAERIAQLAEATGIEDLQERWSAWLRAFPPEIPLDDPDALRMARSALALQRFLRAAA